MKLFSDDFIKDYFNEKSLLYLDYGYDILGERSNFLSWIEALKEPVLEIGCGKGYFTAVLSDFAREVIAIDPDKDAIEFASSFVNVFGTPDNVRFINCKAEELPLPDKSVGTIVCFNMWHHLENSDSLLREIRRVLSPDGIFAVADFSKEGFSLVEQIHRKVYGGSHPVCRTGFDDIKAFFSDADVFVYESKYEDGLCVKLRG